MNESVKISYSKSIVFSNVIISSVIYYFVIRGLIEFGFNAGLITILLLLTILLTYQILRFWIPLFSKNPAVELTSEGVIDHINNRKILWKDIERLQYRNAITVSGNVVIFNVKEPETYYAGKFAGGLRYWINKIYDGYPVVIRTMYTNVSAKELFDLISGYYDSHGKK